MTNNDELALKPVGNLFTSDKGEVLFSPSKWPISGFGFAGCVYSAEQVNTLLAERDTDKKRIEMLEGANASQDDHINQQQDRIEALEQRNSELGKYAGKLEAISAAAEKLVRCKGRYHSEQNYRALAALFGVTTPDLPPLETEARTVSVKLPRDITHVTNKYFEEGRDAVLEAIKSQLADDGINLKVGE